MCLLSEAEIDERCHRFGLERVDGLLLKGGQVEALIIEIPGENNFLTVRTEPKNPVDIDFFTIPMRFEATAREALRSHSTKNRATSMTA